MGQKGTLKDIITFFSSISKTWSFSRKSSHSSTSVSVSFEWVNTCVRGLQLCLAHRGQYGTVFCYYFYYLEDFKDIVNNVINQVEINLKMVKKIAGSSWVKEDYFMVILRVLGSLGWQTPHTPQHTHTHTHTHTHMMIREIQVLGTEAKVWKRLRDYNNRDREG